MTQLIPSNDGRRQLAEPRPPALSDAGSGDVSTTIRQLWLAIAKRKLLILIMLAIAVIPTATYVTLAKPVYLATATLQIDPESTKILPYQDVTDLSANGAPYYELYIKTQDEILRSDVLQVRTRERAMGELYRVHSDRLVDALADKPSIERVPGSLMLQISQTAADPVLAAEIANRWAEEFIKLQREKRHETGKSATEFLQQQLAALEEKMRAAEAELVEYARTHSILNLDSGQTNVVRQRFEYMSRELARAEKDFIAAKAAIDELNGLSFEQMPKEMKGPVLVGLETRVYEAEQELARLSSKFGEKWPALAEKKGEVELLQRQMQQARTAALGGSRKQLQMRFDAARTEYEMLKSAVAQQAAVVDRLNRDSLDYNSLKRDVETSAQLYQGLLQRLKETSVSTSTAFGNIHLAVPAQPPAEPYRPRKALSLALSLLLGLTFGVGLSVFLESLNDTLEDPWEVEALGLPLLGWLPKVQSDKGAANGTGEGAVRRLLQPSQSSVEGGDEKKSLTSSEYLSRECFRTLCSSIMLSQPECPPTIILVSSAASKEGKTTTTAGLGITLAEVGLETLLIDADLRRPSLAKRFGVEASEGLSTYLAGGTLQVRETGVPSLYLLPSGPIPPNPLALLNSTRMRQVLEQLSQQFRFILIDGPPILSLPEANVLASKVHRVVLVIQAGKTPRDIIRRALRRLQQTGSHVLGAAVNQVNLRHPQYSHYHNYYYYPEHSNGHSRE